MTSQQLGYELRIGNNYNYHDEKGNAMPCKLINILHDGHYVVYEFSHDGTTAVGATIYPQNLRPRK